MQEKSHFYINMRISGVSLSNWRYLLFFRVLFCQSVHWQIALFIKPNVFVYSWRITDSLILWSVPHIAWWIPIYPPPDSFWHAYC